MRITEEAYREDHRLQVKDVTARVRRTAFIPSGNRLAKRVINSCMLCRQMNQFMNKQVMAELPKGALSSAASFMYIVADIFGPFLVKDLAQGRRRLNVWGVVLACLAIKAVAILAYPGCNTKIFGLTYRRFCGIYGEATKVYTDHGPQIKANAETETVLLSKVARDATKRGTEWCFTPKACSWRNGQAEICIPLSRHALSHALQKSTELDYHTLETVLIKVLAVINTRPIAIKYKCKNNYILICPADILFEWAHNARSKYDENIIQHDNVRVRGAHEIQRAVVEAWVEQWMKQAVPEMAPRQIWKHKYRLIKVGDIGHIMYKSIVGSKQIYYRLCRLSKVFPDADNNVGTCMVKFRSRHVGDTGKDYTSGLNR